MKKGGKVVGDRRTGEGTIEAEQRSEDAAKGQTKARKKYWSICRYSKQKRQAGNAG